MKICITGHRPDKLWGYNIMTRNYIALKNKFKELLVKYECDELYDGMALGTDMVCAMAAIELRNEGYNIKLHCAIPCKNHSSLWNDDDKMLYDSIIKQADMVTLVTDSVYTGSYLLKKRNEFMVDNTEQVIAVWNGSASGTSSCINYAKRKNKPIFIIDPKLFINEVSNYV